MRLRNKIKERIQWHVYEQPIIALLLNSQLAYS